MSILLLGRTLYWTSVCAVALGVLRDDIPQAVAKAIKRRTVIAQALYAFGALLCLINTYTSIEFYRLAG